MKKGLIIIVQALLIGHGYMHKDDKGNGTPEETLPRWNWEGGAERKQEVCSSEMLSEIKVLRSKSQFSDEISLAFLQLDAC